MMYSSSEPLLVSFFALFQKKTHDHFDHQGDMRAEEAVLLHIPRILSMGS